MTSNTLRRAEFALIRFACFIGLISLMGSSANAVSIHQSLPDLSGLPYDATTVLPLPPITVGAFSDIHGNNWLVSGMVSGRFGNLIASSSAGVDDYLVDGGDPVNDVRVAQCINNDA